MDAQRFKHPRPALAFGVPLHVLSLWQIEAAQQAADAWARREGTSLAMANLELGVQLLARAARADWDAVRQLHRNRLVALLEAWARHQADSTPDGARLEAELRLAVLRDPAIRLDGAAAHHAKHAHVYYGRQLKELTVGQLVYFWTLSNVYRELVVEKDQGRSYSRRWLETRARGDAA